MELRCLNQPEFHSIKGLHRLEKYLQKKGCLEKSP